MSTEKPEEDPITESPCWLATESDRYAILRARRRDHVIEQQRIVENPHQSVKTAKGIRVAEWLLEQGVDYVGMREDVSHKGPGYVLSNGGVRIQKISAGRIDEAAREILDRGGMIEVAEETR